jgi:hypothetical protein
MFHTGGDVMNTAKHLLPALDLGLELRHVARGHHALHHQLVVLQRLEVLLRDLVGLVHVHAIASAFAQSPYADSAPLAASRACQ